MLKIDKVIEESYDEAKGEFVPERKVCFTLEHSLISISKWEAKFHKAFLDVKEKTPEEMEYYIKCMCVTQNVPDEMFKNLPDSIIKEVFDYIQDPMSATVFNDYSKGKVGRGLKGDTVTSELIYYWMSAYQLDWSCEKWHLNRLLNLIKICNIKNQDPKDPKNRMSRKEILERNARLNAERRAKLNTKG